MTGLPDNSSELPHLALACIQQSLRHASRRVPLILKTLVELDHLA